MSCCGGCAEGTGCADDAGTQQVSAQGLISTGGVIVPAICGPFGILPIRLRARVSCMASKDATGKTLASANQILNSNAHAANELPQASPLQAMNILFRAGFPSILG